MPKPKKEDQILEIVRDAAEKGNYRITPYALKRMKDRNIIVPEILDILKTGYTEKKKITSMKNVKHGDILQ